MTAKATPAPPASFATIDAASSATSVPLTISVTTELQRDRVYLRRLADADAMIREASPRAHVTVRRLASEAIADHGMTAAGVLFISSAIRQQAEYRAAGGELRGLELRDTLAVAMLVGAGATAQYTRHRC